MSGVVVAVGAVIGGVIGGASSISGISKQNKNLIKTFNKQMKYLQMNYNYNEAALDRQERSMYDSAVLDLFQLSVNAFQNQSQVVAAQAESGVEGRTQDKLAHVIRGQNFRQKTAVKEAYETEVWNVRSQKEALYIETKNAVEQARDNLNNSFIKGAKMYAQVFQGVTIGAALGAATAGAGSAIGGAIGGAAGGAAGGSAGSLTAGAMGGTSIGTLSGAGVSSSVGAGLSTAPVTASGASLGALSGAGISSSVGSGLSSTPLTINSISGSTSGTLATQFASAGSKASTGFFGRAASAWNAYSPYVNMYNKIANYGNMTTNIYRRQRGYYY